jgi:Domain of unknown function (DUF4383)
MSTSPSDRARMGAGTALVRSLALVVGIVFLVVGVLGFVPGITTNYSELTFAGHMSDAKLVGLFEVSILHNIVHLLFGVAGVAMARRTNTAVTYLVGGGVIYLVLWIYGLLVGQESAANFVPLNTADNWLHFLLGVGMIAMGLLGRQSAARAITATR